MNFESNSAPRQPTPRQITELDDLLSSGRELEHIYSMLELHPRIIDSPKALELFISFREQLQQDLPTLKAESMKWRELAPDPVEKNASRFNRPASFAQDEHELTSPHLAPDVEPIDVAKSVFVIVKRSFHVESLFNAQLAACLASAQNQDHLRLQLQLKMIKLSATQRLQLLEERYGYARSKSLLFQGLRRQTTRFLSAISGEKRTDIDR